MARAGESWRGSNKEASDNFKLFMLKHLAQLSDSVRPECRMVCSAEQNRPWPPSKANRGCPQVEVSGLCRSRSTRKHNFVIAHHVPCFMEIQRVLDFGQNHRTINVQ